MEESFSTEFRISLKHYAAYNGETNKPFVYKSFHINNLILKCLGSPSGIIFWDCNYVLQAIWNAMQGT